jgi:hypothetical protein
MCTSQQLLYRAGASSASAYLTIACAFLQGLLHSDLTANNILLQSVGGPPLDLTGAFEVLGNNTAVV